MIQAPFPGNSSALGIACPENGYSLPRILAYYLPQFYRTRENDNWHGKGFTEWTKVREARPLWSGHYQPRRPHESIGEYSLDSIETIREQATLANQYGIQGFIFYHYWFHGRRILEKPAKLILSHPEVSLNYCFSWANESWTRRWDGGDRSILLEQRYSRKDWDRHIDHLAQHFSDPRYIKINDRPLLFIYRPHLIPDPIWFTNRLRARTTASGGLTPYLVAELTTPPGFLPTLLGFDAVAHRPMYHWSALAKLHQNANGSGGLRLNYQDVVDFYIEELGSLCHHPVIPSVVPGWDVSPRHGSSGVVIVNRDPKVFERWLVKALRYAMRNSFSGESLVTVNSWNEWAEGSYLEPDEQVQFSNLQAVKNALELVNGNSS
jgi:lipopolysaccharide biosynthesis protein